MSSSLLAAVTVAGGIVASDVSPTFAVAEPPTPHLVGDLERAGVDSGPRDFVGLGDVVVFAARDQEVGSELWRYDTSDGNVTLLTDIVPGPEGSMIRLFHGELHKRVFALSLDIVGPEALRLTPVDGEGNWTGKYLQSFAYTIGGGTTDIQRNIVGERVLGLPREPKPAA